MAYVIGNTYAKNLCQWTVFLQLIIKNVVTCFFGTQCIFFITYRAYVSGVLCGHYNAHMLKCFRLADVKLAVYG